MAVIRDESIAIIGIGCRFPGGVESPESYWKLLTEGRDGVIEVPPDRWQLDAFYDPRPDMPGKMYVRAGGFLRREAQAFDAHFFGISPREAAFLDPQQRLLLEVAWEAFEDAGVPPDALAGSDTGVYVGGFMADNFLTQFSPLNRDQIGTHTAVSSTLSILSNRLSYVFDFRGPSVTMDTACSSSLVAVHQACQALRRGECGLALAGGVNFMTRPETVVAMCKGGFLAPDGRSKSFDARADGYGRGEGAGIVLLKPLAAALRDGNEVYALIRGTGVNQDGRTDGITVPNPTAQEALIRRVCAEAGVEPGEVRYVEAHGTGTAVGDPLEARALGAVLGAARGADRPCVVGSVKANIGHLEAAAGVAGLIKAALCLRHKAIPPIANLETLNPAIPFAELGLKPALTLEPMPEGEGPAIAAVNSFGYGGTNAHAILEEAPVLAPQVCDARADGPHLLAISARSRSALASLAQAYGAEAAAGAAVHDLCYSAALHRAHHEQRLAVAGADGAELAERLRRFAEEGQAPGAVAGTADPRGRGPVFVLTGMGPQWWGMGQELLRAEPVFRAFAESCNEAFRRVAGWSVLAEMGRDRASSRVTETQIAQPANFLLQAGLAAWWRSKGVEPAAVVGHSVGEVTAAYLAGALTLEEAVEVAHHRSRLQKRAAGLGTMLALGLGQEEAGPLLRGREGRVSVAAINGPASLTLAGEAKDLREIAAEIERQGTFNRFLEVEVAYHSPFMDPLEAELLASLGGLRPKAAMIPLYSTVRGGPAEAGDYDGAYWFRNVREPVDFAGAMEALAAAGHRVFLEIGPHPVLSASIKQCLAHHGASGHVVASLRRDQPERATLLEGLAGLYASGAAIDWRRCYAQGGAYRRLPTYPWQHDAHWQETETALADRLGRPEHALLGRRLSAPTPAWESRVNRNLLPYLDDHEVENLVVLPGAAYVELGFAAHQAISGRTAHLIEGLEFTQAMVVAPGSEPVLHTSYDEGRREYVVASRAQAGAPWTVHARGRLSFLPFDPPDASTLREITALCTEPATAGAHYAAMDRRGLHYGPYFRGVRELRLSSDRRHVLARIEGDARLDAAQHRNRLHPSLLDACFQSLLALIDVEEDASVYVPVSIREARLHRPPEGAFWCYGRRARHGRGQLEGDILLYDEAGQVFAELKGICAQALSAGAGKGRFDGLFYRFAWQERPLAATGVAAGRYVVLTDDIGVGAGLAEELAAMGAEEVVRVLVGTRYERRGQDYAVAADDKAALRDLLEGLAVQPLAGIVHLWSVDNWEWDGDPLGAANLAGGLALVQAVTEGGIQAPVTFVTRRAHPVLDPVDEAGLTQAPLQALVRTAINEHGDHRFRMVDVDDGEACVRDLAREIVAGDEEDDVAYRAGRRFVCRFVRRSSAELASGCGDLLAEGAPPRQRPEAGEVEVAVRRALALDGIGTAAVGRVVRAGPGEAAFRRGQDVLLLGEGPPSAFVTLKAGRICAAPEGEADGLAWLTLAAAHHALVRVARLAPGERVLVLDAASPLGLAAAELARSLGAVVDAAAGPERHAALHGLGWRRVADSSSLGFVEQVLADSRGVGVDVVFSTGGGEVAERALRLLAPGGRFLDLRGLDPKVRPPANRTLSGIDLGGLMDHDPRALERLVAEVVLAGSALPPIAVGGLHGIVEFAEPPADFNGVETALPVGLDARGTYLVTGGFGGLGLKLAGWLADRGVRNLVLVSRRGAATPGGEEAVRVLEARGVRVLAAAADIAERAEVERLLGEVGSAMPPLKGVFHTAAVLDDAPIYTLRPEQLANVLRPKALGAWQLHRRTEGMGLDLFVMFSSIASLLGSPGQATYVAANAFLDALAHYRRARGLPAISVNLGAVSEVGMAARHEGVEHHLSRVGVGSFTPAEVMRALERVLLWNPIQVGVAAFDWSLWGGSYPAWAASPRYRGMMPAVEAGEGGEAAGSGALAELEPEARRAAVAAILTELLAEVLRLPPAKIDPGASLLAMGVDSLMAMELQATIGKRIGVKLSVLELMKGSSMAALAAQAADGLGRQAEAAEQPMLIRELPGTLEDLAGLDELSDEAVEAAIERLTQEGIPA